MKITIAYEKEIPYLYAALPPTAFALPNPSAVGAASTFLICMI